MCSAVRSGWLGDSDGAFARSAQRIASPSLALRAARFALLAISASLRLCGPLSAPPAVKTPGRDDLRVVRDRSTQHPAIPTTYSLTKRALRASRLTLELPVSARKTLISPPHVLKGSREVAGSQALAGPCSVARLRRMNASRPLCPWAEGLRSRGGSCGEMPACGEGLL